MVKLPHPCFSRLGNHATGGVHYSFLYSHGVSLSLQKVLVLNSSAFLTLSNKTARGDAREPWAALRAAPTSRNWEPVYQIARTYFIKNS